MSGYERRKQATHEQILRAAIRQFAKNGVRKTTIQEIAAEAGTSPVSVYNHFTDKINLVKAAVMTISEEMFAEFRRIMASDRPWRERLEKIILRKHQSFLEFRGDFIETLYRDLPDLVEEIRERQLRVREEITDAFLDEGRRLGFIPAEISNDAVAVFLECISRGFDSAPYLLDRLTSNPELFAEFYDLLIYGLVRDSGAANNG